MRSKTSLIYYKSNSHNNSRLGISASKKFGNAIKRNTFKRLVREYFRKSNLKEKDFDILVVANNKFFDTKDSISSEYKQKLREDLSVMFSKITN